MTNESEDFFARPQDYDRFINQGLRLSGEGREFFAAGRVDALRRLLPVGFAPETILDYGCGIGDSTKLLAERFPAARVTGVDMAEEVVEYAQRSHGCHPQLSFLPSNTLSGKSFDVCYMNGVLHHVQPSDRPAVINSITEQLRERGLLAIFENNPASIAARVVMRRIPFDRDAVLLWPREVRRLMESAGLTRYGRGTYLFLFPRVLAPLRRFEWSVRRLPLGAQYLMIGRKS